MIAELRCKKGLTQKELMHGLGEIRELSRIEAGNRMPEKLLADALFQRLGKSTDALEQMIPEKEYALFLMREYLQYNISFEHWEENQEIIKEYEKCATAEKPLHRQYLKQMDALNEYCRKWGRTALETQITEKSDELVADASLCRERLEKALEITFCEWQQKSWTAYYLCAQELRLAVLIAYMEELCGKREAALGLLTKVLEYLERIYGTEEQGKILPQCAWLLAKLYGRKKSWSEMEKICKKGIQSLVENGGLLLLEELLELRLTALNKLAEGEAGVLSVSDAGELLTEVSGQLASLHYVFSEFWQGERKSWNDLQRILIHYQDQELAINYETLRDLRYSWGISQFELSDGTRSAETISRIEQGKHNPTISSFRSLTNAMGIQRDYHQGRIQTDRFELLELVHQRNQAVFQLSMEESRALRKKLEAELNKELPLNRQYIETCKIQEMWHEGTLSPEESIRRLNKALHETMPDYKGTVKRIPTRGEFAILNQIAFCEDKKGNLERAIEIYEQLLEVYHKSIVKEKYHKNSILLLYLNYGERLERADRLEEAEKADRRGVQVEIECGKSEMLGVLLANMSFVYAKKHMPEREKELLRHSYNLCRMLGNDNQASRIQKYYQRKFRIELRNPPQYHQITLVY